MGLKKLYFFLIFLLSIASHAQVPKLSPISKISVLTCGPGKQLYSTFGHSAFRVKDPALGIDVVYNYGVFDFNSNNFYVKFAQGKLDYMLARQQYSNFIREYKYDKRWVKEQVLSLSQEEINELFQFLEHNYLPENRTYQYDFFYNNCSTKIWDVLKVVFGEKLKLDADYLSSQFTHRELIRQNMPINSWSAFGIDLALGSVIDDLATPKEHMFLPLYVMEQLNTSQLDAKPIAPNEVSIYQPIPIDNKDNFLLTPLFWSIVLMIVVMAISITDFRRKKRTKWLDFSLFFVTGFAGIVIFFLWFMTDHTATVNNFNLLWAFPLNFVFAFLLWKKNPFSKVTAGYLLMLLIFLPLVVVLWFMGIQRFSPVIIPILGALDARYTYLFLTTRKINIPF